MQWLAELCVRRPVFASVLILSLVVVGAFAFGHFGAEFGIDLLGAFAGAALGRWLWSAPPTPETRP